LKASLNAKSLRKTQTTLNGDGEYFCILQGKLSQRGSAVEEAGLGVQAKAPKPAPSVPAAA